MRILLPLFFDLLKSLMSLSFGDSCHMSKISQDRQCIRNAIGAKMKRHGITRVMVADHDISLYSPTTLLHDMSKHILS